MNSNTNSNNTIAEDGEDVCDAASSKIKAKAISIRVRSAMKTTVECVYCSIVAHVHCLPIAVAESITNMSNSNNTTTNTNSNTNAYEWICDSCVEDVWKGFCVCVY